jgi:ribosomal protein S18 acetylase RimI-like enzyme
MCFSSNWNESGMDWTTRRATTADADRLALIGGATFLDTFAGLLDGDAIVDHCAREHSSSTYRRYLSEGAQAWLVEACSGTAPVGFSLLGSTDLPGSTSDGSDIELKRIYTLSRFHGRGIGSALMQQAMDFAEQKGHQRLLLGVYAGNGRARAFYAKNGFRQIADRRFRVGDREYDDVVLARQIGGDRPTS